MKDKVYVDDIGTGVLVNMHDNVVGTTVHMKVLRPDGISVTWTASVHGTEKIIHYTVAGDIPMKGDYLIQGFSDGNGWAGRGATALLKVYDKFK